METFRILDISDVETFFIFLMVEKGLGSGFHPDTPIGEYFNLETGEKTFTPYWADILQKQLETCFKVCNELAVDIYEVGLKLAQQLGFSPRPYEMVLNGYKIEWTGEKWISTDRKGTIRGFQHFQEVVEDCLQP